MDLIQKGGVVAARHMLQREGYEILHEDYANELSLVAEAGSSSLFFFKVSVHVSQHATELEVPIPHPDTRSRMRDLGARWLLEHRGEVGAKDSLRFDAIHVMLSPTGRLIEINHIEDAY